MSSVSVLWCLAVPGLYLGLIGVWTIAEKIGDRRRERGRRPLTPAEQYRVMQIRKRDAMRQLRSAARDVNENRGGRT
jgi:hypothetical protein